MKGLEALERLYIAGDLELDYVLGGKQKDDYDLATSHKKFSNKFFAIIDNHFPI